MIGIVDCGIGNLGSLVNMFKRAGIEAGVAATSEQLVQANKLVLPGVGAFDKGVECLDSSGMRDTLITEVVEKCKPILGICLGMQLMTSGSEEGVLPGLGWVDATTRRFTSNSASTPLRVPHMGWNTVRPQRGQTLFSEENLGRYYFVHSYDVECHDKSCVEAYTDYGQPFVAAYRFKNIWGVQFHPEKSHRFGMKLLKRFATA